MVTEISLSVLVYFRTFAANVSRFCCIFELCNTSVTHLCVCVNKLVLRLAWIRFIPQNPWSSKVKIKNGAEADHGSDLVVYQYFCTRLKCIGVGDKPSIIYFPENNKLVDGTLVFDHLFLFLSKCVRTYACVSICLSESVSKVKWL